MSDSAPTRRLEPPAKIPDSVIADLQDRCNLPAFVEQMTHQTLRRAGSELRGECPLCNGADKLTVYHKDGRWRWKCWSCDDGKGSAITWLMKVGGVEFLDAVQLLDPGLDIDALRRVGISPEARAEAERRQAERATAARQDSEARRAKAWKIWSERMPIAGSPAERYLLARGAVPPWPGSLGFHPKVWTIKPAQARPSGDNRSRDNRARSPEFVAHPALLGCVVSGDRRFLAIHRVFLTIESDGSVVQCRYLPKADLKRARGDLLDGAVRLTTTPATAGGALVLTEGMETGMAVVRAARHAGRLAELGGDMTVWSALYAQQLLNVGFGEGWRPSRIVIMADNDPKSRTGERKAIAACRRFGAEFGIPSAWSMPDVPGWDWNDPLMKSQTVDGKEGVS